MIGNGDHLCNRMKYIDPNMVRAGVVRHPVEWRWCGHYELVGRRQRYRLLDLDRVLELFCQSDPGAFARSYEAAVAKELRDRRLSRNPIWAESIAVGSKTFVRVKADATKIRKKLKMIESADGTWYVSEREMHCGRDHHWRGTGREEI
jgi:putative transposase